MVKTKTIVLIVILSLLGMGFCSVYAGQLHNLGFAVVSPNGPDDGADFGPNTPGTQTSGIQEALDYGKANSRNVYIVGDMGTVYDVHTTIRIPWSIGILDGGEYVIHYTAATGPAITVDSQMNDRVKLGSITAPNIGLNERIVEIKPVSIGPDNMVIMTLVIFKINSITGNAAGPGGVGLAIDPAGSSVNRITVEVGEIDNCNIGLHVVSAHHTKIDCLSIRSCNTHIKIDGGGTNQVYAYMDSEGRPGSVGARLASSNCIYTLSGGQMAAGSDVILETAADNNLIRAIDLPNGITNNAASRDNRVVSLAPIGFNVPTPPVPASNSFARNETPYTVAALIETPGNVTWFRVQDSNGNVRTVMTGLFAGQTIDLEPGDKVMFNYATAPTWSWKALR